MEQLKPLLENNSTDCGLGRSFARNALYSINLELRLIPPVATFNIVETGSIVGGAIKYGNDSSEGLNGPVNSDPNWKEPLGPLQVT